MTNEFNHYTVMANEALAIARLGAQHIDDVGALRPEVVEYGIAQVAGGGLLVGDRKSVV